MGLIEDLEYDFPFELRQTPAYHWPTTVLLYPGRVSNLRTLDLLNWISFDIRTIIRTIIRTMTLEGVCAAGESACVCVEYARSLVLAQRIVV